MWGQGERGGLNGTVTDSTGAVVPNATVTALNVATGVETKATTTDAGVYRLPYLPSGTYTLSATAQGFQRAVREGVVLHVAQTLTVNFEMTVGSVAETITVAAETPLLESSSAEVGRYVGEKEFDTWPIPVSDGHRQIQQFIFSSLPGTVGGTFEGSISGGQYYSHEILIEGIPLGRMDLQGGSNNEFSPSAEGVSEFKLQTGTLSAQYTGGQTAVANFGLKSGTNDLHGAAFTYVQNDWLRANSFANNAQGRRRAPYKLFNWGYAVGGPVYIPKVYNGRNRTFFHTTLEKTRVRDFVSLGQSTLPVVDFKRGDFSRLFDPGFTGNARSGQVIGTDAAGRPIRFGQIYDPRTARSVDGRVVRDPFVNNVIPENQWSAVSRAILQQAPIADPSINRMLNNIPNLNACCPIFDERIIGVKGDHAIGNNHRLSGYFNHHYRFRNNSPGGRWGHPLSESPTGVFQNQNTPGRLARLAHDWTISASMINHIALGYNRFGNINESVYVDQDWPQKIGLQNVPGTHFPTLTFSGQAHQGGGVGAGGRLGSANAGGGYNGSSILQDDLTWVRGTHSFKFGFEGRRYYYNTRTKSGSGTFAFSPNQTNLAGFATETGHAFASFMLGAAASTSRGVNLVSPGHRSTELGFYFADDWKVTKKLTLNMGLRWEFIGPLYEVAGRMSGLDPDAPNPGAGNRPGALAFVDDRDRKSFMDWYPYQLSPRFGFAYQVSEKLVVRGGYGINNTPPIMDGFGFPSTFGFNGSISVNAQNVALRFPDDPVIYLHDRYPDFQGTLPNKNPALQNGQGITYMAEDGNRLPYVQNYNFGFQYQLPFSTVLEVTYIGNKGTRLRARGFDELNQLPVSALSQYGDALRDQVSARPGLVPLPYAGFTGTVAQALRRFPQYQGVSEFWAPFGTSRYDSLQVMATRHFRSGFGVLAAYTWSKTIALTDSAIDFDLEGVQDVNNRALERSITRYHVPHFLKATWIYELPIGPGKLLNLQGVAGKILGGWTITGIHNYRSGNPLRITTSGLNNPLFSSAIRPDVVAGAPHVVYGGEALQFGTGTQYLNPAAFQQVPRTANNVPLRLGTAPPYLPNTRGFARVSEDFGLLKRFAFTEQAGLEIRADFLNAFNRAGKGDPNTDVTSALFGKITGAAYGPRNIQVGARFSF